MGKISTHVLDTTTGGPASNMKIELLREVDGRTSTVAEVHTNEDGRTNGPLVEGDDLEAGAYRLLFHVGSYFEQQGNPYAGVFLDIVPVYFRVSDHRDGYHVPLLVSPWAYSTYRGS